MEDEQYYLFVDKTGNCFESFQKTGKEGCHRNYNILVGAWLQRGRKFTVEDMMCFRDDLTDAGFKWGIDFYVKKVDKTVVSDTIKI